MLVITTRLLYGIWIIQLNIRRVSKGILKYTLGASCKDSLDSTSFKSDIFKCTGSDFAFLIKFFFPFSGKLQVSSKWVWASGNKSYKRTRKASGCWYWAVWVPVCITWLYISCPWEQLKYDTTPVRLQQLCWVLQTAFGEMSCVCKGRF